MFDDHWGHGDLSIYLRRPTRDGKCCLPLVHAVPQQGGDRQREFKKSSYCFVLLRESILLNKHVVTDKPQANQTNKPHAQSEPIWARA